MLPSQIKHSIYLITDLSIQLDVGDACTTLMLRLSRSLEEGGSNMLWKRKQEKNGSK